MWKGLRPFQAAQNGDKDSNPQAVFQICRTEHFQTLHTNV